MTFPLIAASLLLTNLSTEQMAGLNGAAFIDGLRVMVWEVVAVVALVTMARVITKLISLIAYATILLPIILYTGARGMIGILDIQGMLGISEPTALWLIVLAIYAVFADFSVLR